MAGRGFAPKPADQRAGHHKDHHATTVLPYQKPPAPPALPRYVKWHPRTRAWWNMWKKSPQASTFTATDWSFLLDTALMHHKMWQDGEIKWAAEIRLRVAKYGATPEDRARLRMEFAEPPKSGEKSPAPASPARARYGNLRAVASH